MSRKKPTEQTIKRLYALSGNKCAFPGCNAILASSTNVELISQICHIEAAEVGGERYNSKQTDEERRSFENLILLCANHHNTTNNINEYTVAILKEMKKNHETKCELSNERFVEFQKYPSLIATVINSIYKSKIIGKGDGGNEKKPFSIVDKIDYNKIIRYKPLIEKFKTYQGNLSRIYREHQKNGSDAEDILLEKINCLYIEVKQKLGIGNDISKIQENADNIIDGVKIGLEEIIDNSNNLDGIPIEMLDIGILIIIVDAFMKCKILEEPLKEP